MLKSDFHMHSNEDWYDSFQIRYSAKELITMAAKKKYEVMALTHHNHVFFNKELESFAKKRGILLIPGVESTIEGKHVLLIGASNKDLAQIKGFQSLDKIRDHVVVIAAHPFFKVKICMGEKLFFKHKDRFDAIEYSSFYSKLMMREPLKTRINGNERARQIAEQTGKPLVGNSDCHRRYDIGHTFTWVDADKDKESVLEAIRKGNVEVETKAVPTLTFARRVFSCTLKEQFLRYKHGETVARCSIFGKSLITKDLNK